jgi:hypothetical protein
VVFARAQVSNLLIINSPPPVGYSYCDATGPNAPAPTGPAGHGDSCGAWNDTRTAELALDMKVVKCRSPLNVLNYTSDHSWY